METLSFILGIASVVVFATAIVTVISIVKVIKVTKQFNEYVTSMSHEIDIRTKDIQDQVSRNYEILDRRIDNTEREIFSQLDSRLDKLENKLSGSHGSKQVIN
jgi:predicted PurR-regulated permease PerM